VFDEGKVVVTIPAGPTRVCVKDAGSITVGADVKSVGTIGVVRTVAGTGEMVLPTVSSWGAVFVAMEMAATAGSMTVTCEVAAMEVM
jgi:hypothetical protein